MNPGNPLLWLPLALAFIFLVIGYASSWRTVAGFLIAGYAAIVIASQHNTVFAAIMENYFDASNYTNRQQSALAFGITLTVLFLVIYILYRVAWQPMPEENPNALQQGTTSGWTRLLMASLNLALGWSLGALLLVCILVFQPLRGNLAFASGSQEYTNAVYGTVNLTLDLAKPWIADGFPIALRGD